MNHCGEIIRQECVRTCGCTDPGSVALAAARAVSELQEKPEHLDVFVSSDLYKNGAWVMIPGTQKTGLDYAAALGMLIRDYSKGLSILENMDQKKLDQACEFVSQGRVHVSYGETEERLYICVKAVNASEEAEAVIEQDYDRIQSVKYNGKILLQKENQESSTKDTGMEGKSIHDIYEMVMNEKIENLEYLLEYAKINVQAAETGFRSEKMLLGPALKKKGFRSTEEKASAYVSAAAEARMQGLMVPIIAITGSGNHGIVNFIAPYIAAEECGADREHTIRALALCSMITIYIKNYLHRMTAFCGCTVAASVGVSAAEVYLKNGDYAQMTLAMQSVIESLSGMLCDGAKVSCAYKAGIGVRTAIQLADLAIENCGIPAPVGILGLSIEDTIRNMAQINNPGMLETDREIVSIIYHNKEAVKNRK